MQSQPEQQALFDGARLRDEALVRLARANPDWNKWIKEVAIHISNQNGEVSTDELHVVADQFNRHPKEPRAYGCAFRPAKHWLKLGYKTSKRPECHARPIAKWWYQGERTT